MNKKVFKIIFIFIFLILMLFIHTTNIYALDISVDKPGLYIWSPFLYSISPIIFKGIVALGIISLVCMLISLAKHDEMKFALIYFVMYSISAITLKISKTESLSLIYINKLEYITMLSVSLILRIVMIVYPISRIVKHKKKKEDKSLKGDK